MEHRISIPVHRIVHSSINENIFWQIINGQNKVKVVADRCLFRVPGWKTMLDALSIMSGTREECEAALNAGSTLVLSPGGTREMLYSDSNYKVFWGSRLGYAKIAIKCQVPIYPVFTRNIREVSPLMIYKAFSVIIKIL